MTESISGVPGDLDVVVTTEKGVFFGRMDRERYVRIARTGEAPGTVLLYDAQVCVYWSQDMRGFGGLASHGPSATCKIGRPVAEKLIPGVTSISVASMAAAAAWRSSPWA